MSSKPSWATYCSDSAWAPVRPSRPHNRPVAGKCRRMGLAGACWEHLVSTCNRHRVAMAWGCLVGHPPWLPLSSKQESARLRGRASADRPDPLDTPCHAYAPRASPGLGPQLF